jgi:hypothetical protein
MKFDCGSRAPSVISNAPSQAVPVLLNNVMSKEEEKRLLHKYRQEPLPPGWKVYLSRLVR